MKLLAKCPKCAQNIELTIDMADKRVRCRRCRNMFKVPDMGNLNKAMKILKKAKTTIYVDQDGKIYG